VTQSEINYFAPQVRQVVPASSLHINQHGEKRTQIDDSSDSSGSDTGDDHSSKQDQRRRHDMSQSNNDDAEGLDISASMPKHSLLEVSWLKSYMQ
jgi:hypothetical protein